MGLVYLPPWTWKGAHNRIIEKLCTMIYVKPYEFTSCIYMSWNTISLMVNIGISNLIVEGLTMGLVRAPTLNYTPWHGRVYATQAIFNDFTCMLKVLNPNHTFQWVGSYCFSYNIGISTIYNYENQPGTVLGNRYFLFVINLWHTCI